MLSRLSEVNKIQEIRIVFQGLQTLYDTYLPKVDPMLIHDLLVRERQSEKGMPFYMVEIFTKPGTDSTKIKDNIFNKTGMIPAVYDNGTHYVTNQRLNLEMLKELSDSESVLEVTGDYTGGITGRGASHDRSH
jgi:hypothetical protein